VVKTFKAAVHRLIRNKNIPNRLIDRDTRFEARQEVQYFQLAKELGITPDELKKKPYHKVERWMTILSEINDYKSEDTGGNDYHY